MGAILVILAVVNLSNNYVAVPAYVATALIAMALLLLVHRAAAGSWDDAGLARAVLPRGARWGLTLIAMVALCYLVAALLPASRVLFLDGRVDRASSAAIAFQILIRMPLGTVLLEEVAFRGVLYGLLRRGCGVAWATAISSVLFALWHIPPALHLANANPALAGANTAAAVALALVGAALAGVALCELRRRSGSLLAPIGLHWATNALGYLTATMVLGGF